MAADNPLLPPDPCYLDGQWTTIDQARVSVLDRGFIFGDGVYEVIPAYGGRLFAFDAHMERLERSLAALRIPPPFDRDGWRQIARRLLLGPDRPAAASGSPGLPSAPPDQMVYLQVTRGVAPRDHAMIPGLRPTVLAAVSPMRPVPPAVREAGASCVSAPDFRWEKAHIKSTSLLGAVLARQISVDAGALETVMFRRGWLSEAAASNVWVVRDGVVMGPPRNHLVLEGVRYGIIEQLCAQAGIGFRLCRIPRRVVLSADELLLSSASKEVLAVTCLDGQPVGNGRPGPVYQALYAAYQQAKKDTLA